MVSHFFSYIFGVAALSVTSAISGCGNDREEIQDPKEEILVWVESVGGRVRDDGSEFVVDLSGLAFDESEFEALEWSDFVTELKLSGSSILDNSLANLSDAKKLKRLDLGNTMISDDGLGHLSKLKQLELLDLRRTNVSADGILNISRNLPGIEILLE